MKEARRPDEPSDLLTLNEACDRLGADAKRVYVLVREGRLHPVRLPGGKRIYYLDFEVEAILRLLYAAPAA